MCVCVYNCLLKIHLTKILSAYYEPSSRPGSGQHTQTLPSWGSLTYVSLSQNVITQITNYKYYAYYENIYQ